MNLGLPYTTDHAYHGHTADGAVDALVRTLQQAPHWLTPHAAWTIAVDTGRKGGAMNAQTLPEMTPVQSSTIAALGYHAQTATLVIQFKHKGRLEGGSVYRYGNVPPAVYHALLEAPSIGRSFAQTMRGNPAYPCTKLPDAPLPVPTSTRAATSVFGFCPLCHLSGGWTWGPYGDGHAHTDCITSVGADHVATLDELQEAERRLADVGHYFVKSCGVMASEDYHRRHRRRYLLLSDAHFASYTSLCRFIDAESYQRHLEACDAGHGLIRDEDES